MPPPQCPQELKQGFTEADIQEAADTSLHERRRAERMRDPEYREAYERSAREIEQEAVEAEVWGGRMDGVRIELCGPDDCRCGGCDVD